MLPSSEDRKIQAGRIRFLLWTLAVLWLALIGRLYYLQIVQGKELLEQSENNRVKLLRMRAARGTMLDRKGRVLATSRRQFVVMAIPEQLKKDPEAFHTLSGVLGIAPEELGALLEKYKGRPGSPTRVMSDVDLSVVAKLGEMRMRLPGVSVELDHIREYRDGPMLGHTIGYIREIDQEELTKREQEGKNYSPGDYIGKTGLERQYEDLLRGIDGGKQIEVNAKGRVVRVLGEKPTLQGNTLHLTIDRALQVAAHRALGSQVGGVVAVDPRTGAVLAMASRPGFDPNIFVKGVKPKDWKKIADNKHTPMQNRAVQNAYPPGSTFKPIVAIAALMNGACSPSTTVVCRGSIPLGRRVKRCWKVHGAVDMNQAIAQSCDIWFYAVSKRLGIDRLAPVAKSFGIGSKTGIDLPSEKAGKMPDSEWKKRVHHESWYPGDTLNVGIGQGYVQVTPLQMAVACAAVANGGTIYQPYLVEKAVGTDGSTKWSHTVTVTANVDAPASAYDIVRRGMRTAVTSGTARVVNLPDVAVGAKTGSAEDPPRAAHGWFICYAPADNPQIAIACIIEQGRHGATSAAPVCRAILDVFFNKRKPETVKQFTAKTAGD